MIGAAAPGSDLGVPGASRCALSPPEDSLAWLGASTADDVVMLKSWVARESRFPGTGVARLRACPGPPLTLLKLFFVIRLWLGGHDLEEGLENAPQIAGIVGLQLVGHACGGRPGEG